jgi:hypothetical protein
MANGEPVFMRGRAADEGAQLPRGELRAMPDYHEVGTTGLGFVYVPQHLDYTFYADRYGEDIHFWWDHPDISVHLAKQIVLGHLKEVLLLDPPEPTPVLA